MSGAVHPQGRVLVYDDNGAEPALDAAELLAARGAAVELVTPERMLAPDVGSMNSPAYLRAFAEHDVTAHPGPPARRRTPGRGGGLVALLGSDYTDARARAARRPRRRRARHAAQRRALPRPGAALHATAAPSTTRRCSRSARSRSRARPTAGFQLFRIGDAVTSRNIHAAVYDALRLCSAI